MRHHYPDGIPIFDEAELPDLVRELEETISAVPCDVVMVGTPFDLGRLVRSTRPLIRVSYSLDEASTLALGRVLDGFPSSRKG